MKKSRSFGKGLVAGIVIWLFIILADAIDEFVLDVDSFLGINGSLVVLLCMIVAYIVYYIKKKPGWKNILCFFAGYLLTGAATGWIIWNALENETFFIEQTRKRCYFLCLNGIKRTMYYNLRHIWVPISGQKGIYSMKKTIITVVGKDTVGIIAKVCTYLAENKINILDISQTIVQGYFNMMMIVDTAESTKSHGDMADELEKLGEGIGVIIKCQKEEIFDMMHRV